MVVVQRVGIVQNAFMPVNTIQMSAGVVQDARRRTIDGTGTEVTSNGQEILPSQA